MYSKPLLRKLIERRLRQREWTYYRLAKELGISQSNLTRAFESETNNLTLPQFAHLVQMLDLSPEQVYQVLTNRKQ